MNRFNERRRRSSERVREWGSKRAWKLKWGDGTRSKSQQKQRMMLWAVRSLVVIITHQSASQSATIIIYTTSVVVLQQNTVISGCCCTSSASSSYIIVPCSFQLTLQTRPAAGIRLELLVWLANKACCSEYCWKIFGEKSSCDRNVSCGKIVAK
jgi:hypothetical protein